MSYAEYSTQSFHSITLADTIRNFAAGPVSPLTEPITEKQCQPKQQPAFAKNKYGPSALFLTQFFLDRFDPSLAPWGLG